MAFLSSKTLKKRIPSDSIILPFNPDRLQSSAYELSMGKEAYVTTDDTKKNYMKGEQIVIKPGQFGVLITEESLRIPKDLIAFISIKFGIKFKGLVNVSGFHVDPGFEGKLKFSVYNAGSKDVVIAAGDPIFQIWFSELDDEDDYNGIHKDQNGISSNDVMDIHGNTVSPSELAGRIEKIENKLGLWQGVFYGLIVPLLIFVFSISFKSCSNGEVPKNTENNSTIIHSDSTNMNTSTNE